MSPPANLIVRAPAKLNLFLELLNKRPDGYHEIATVMLPVNCFDTLAVRRLDDSAAVRLQVHWSPGRSAWTEMLGPVAEQVLAIPGDDSNLINRAIAAARQRFGLSHGIAVQLRKRIPPGAGMGGASSDAAAALLAVAAVSGIDPADRRLTEIAAAIGSDVPFFLPGPSQHRCTGRQTATVATGRGERLRRVPLGRRLWFVVAYPPQALSTAEVYRRAEVPHRPESLDNFLAALTSPAEGALHSVLWNRLSHPAQCLSPKVGELLSSMRAVGLRPTMMTGSGSACFSLCVDQRQAVGGAQRLAAQLRRQQSFAGAPGWIRVMSSIACKPRLRSVSEKR